MLEGGKGRSRGKYGKNKDVLERDDKKVIIQSRNKGKGMKGKEWRTENKVKII